MIRRQKFSLAIRSLTKPLWIISFSLSILHDCVSIAHRWAGAPLHKETAAHPVAYTIATSPKSSLECRDGSRIMMAIHMSTVWALKKPNLNQDGAMSVAPRRSLLRLCKRWQRYEEFSRLPNNSDDLMFFCKFVNPFRKLLFCKRLQTSVNKLKNYKWT